MPPRYSGKGEIMDESSRYARFATHLNSKKAGPLICPICNATESFEAKGALVGPPSDPLASTELPTPTDPSTPTDPRFVLRTVTRLSRTENRPGRRGAYRGNGIVTDASRSR